MFDFKNKTQLSQKQENTENTKTQRYSVEDLDQKKNNMGKVEQSSFDAGEIKVYAMPDKFLSGGREKIKSHLTSQSETKKITGNKKNILIGAIIGIVIISMLSLASWFFIKSIETPESQNLLVEQETQKQKNTENTKTLNEDDKEKPQEVCSAEKCRLCNSEECLELSDACHLEDLCILRDYRNEEFCPDYICVAGPTQEIEVEEGEEMGELTLSRDSDFDKLTDIEEGLWGTDPLVSDTDSDGYNDGIEIENLYNPLVAGSGTGKLSESDLIKSFSNSSYGYSIYYPASWQINDSYIDQVRFTSNTGEFVQVIIQDNYMGYLTAKDWYVDQNPSAVEEDLEEVLIGNWSGIRSPDGLNIYLVNNNYIYTLIMNIGLKTELNYSTTFEMMLNSFRLFESPLD